MHVLDPYLDHCLDQGCLQVVTVHKLAHMPSHTLDYGL